MTGEAISECITRAPTWHRFTAKNSWPWTLESLWPSFSFWFSVAWVWCIISSSFPHSTLLLLLAPQAAGDFKFPPFNAQFALSPRENGSANVNISARRGPPVNVSNYGRRANRRSRGVYIDDRRWGSNFLMLSCTNRGSDQSLRFHHTGGNAASICIPWF